MRKFVIPAKAGIQAVNYFLKIRFKAWAPAFAGATLLIVAPVIRAEDETWANWERKWDEAFRNMPAQSLPGRAMGVIVPSDTRQDILPMVAFGYEALSRGAYHTAIILMSAPADYTWDGLAVPLLDTLDTPIGRFPIDGDLRSHLLGGVQTIHGDPDLFIRGAPPVLLRQLAGFKYILKKDVRTLKILPIYVKFSDANAQIKDYAPVLVDKIREWGADDETAFVIVANGTSAPSEEKLVTVDAPLLKSLRELDVEGMMASKIPETQQDDLSCLLLGVLTLKWMGADHADVLAYSHSGQLVLTKDRKAPLSYITAGIASKPPSNPRVPHVMQEKMAERFGELLRSDMLALARQTLLSTVDPTAAKPPAINNPESGKKWPIYVSVFDPQGKLAGQAGTHVPLAPLEESIRKYTFEATRKAQPDLNKTNASTYVVEISIPYGFEKVNKPDDLIPLLNGIVVQQRLKTQAIHPDAWRTYPDPHQLLGVISTRLGFYPWAYALTTSHLDSFRVLSFNEKEPFQDLGSSKKRKKKKTGDEIEDDTGGGGGGGGGGSLFTF